MEITAKELELAGGSWWTGKLADGRSAYTNSHIAIAGVLPEGVKSAGEQPGMAKVCKIDANYRVVKIIQRKREGECRLVSFDDDHRLDEVYEYERHGLHWRGHS